MAEIAQTTNRLRESFRELDDSFNRWRAGILVEQTTNVGPEEWCDVFGTGFVFGGPLLVDSKQWPFLLKSYQESIIVKKRIEQFLIVSEWETTFEAKWRYIIDIADEITQPPIYEFEEATIKNLYGIDDETVLQIDEWGIKNQVYKALRFIEETFRSLSELGLNISTDPEIPERKRLRITLTVSGSPADVFEDELRCKELLYSAVDLNACELITFTYKWGD